jgi:hypothetical protein
VFLLKICEALDVPIEVLTAKEGSLSHAQKFAVEGMTELVKTITRKSFMNIVHIRQLMLSINKHALSGEGMVNLELQNKREPEDHRALGCPSP